MRLEITHTVKATNYKAFIDSYKETVAVDREKTLITKNRGFW